METFNYLKANRTYNELYYQYPKIFIEGEKYRHLSEGAKIAYMLLKSRSEVAIHKNQIDSEGNIYFEFTGKELAEMMNCSERRISTLKKELEKFNLLLQIHMGFNKQTGKNEKNRLYLAELEVTEKDIYSMQKREQTFVTPEKSGLENFTMRSCMPEKKKSIDNKGLESFATRSETHQRYDNSGLENFAQEFNNIKQDTVKEDTKEIDTDKNQQLDQEMLSTFHLTNSQTFLTESSLKFIALFSKNFPQAYETVGLIQRAKKKVEKETGIVLIGEEWQEEIELHLRRVVQKIRTDHTIKNADNYMFKSFCYLFQQCSHQSNPNKDATPDISVTLHNWLE